MKTPEEVMEILEAFDLTGSLRAAAALVGCDHNPMGVGFDATAESGVLICACRRAQR